MVKELQTKNDQTTVTIPKTDMDHFKDIATSFISAISEKNANESELGAKRLALSEKKLSYDQSIFKYKFWLLTGGLILLVLISCGLIFVQNKADLGLSILSHVGAIIGGVVAGVGYASSKNT